MKDSLIFLLLGILNDLPLNLNFALSEYLVKTPSYISIVYYGTLLLTQSIIPYLNVTPNKGITIRIVMDVFPPIIACISSDAIFILGAIFIDTFGYSFSLAALFELSKKMNCSHSFTGGIGLSILTASLFSWVLVLICFLSGKKHVPANKYLFSYYAAMLGVFYLTSLVNKRRAKQKRTKQRLGAEESATMSGTTSIGAYLQDSESSMSESQNLTSRLLRRSKKKADTEKELNEKSSSERRPGWNKNSYLDNVEERDFSESEKEEDFQAKKSSSPFLKFISLSKFRRNCLFCFLNYFFNTLQFTGFMVCFSSALFNKAIPLEMQYVSYYLIYSFGTAFGRNISFLIKPSKFIYVLVLLEWGLIGSFVVLRVFVESVIKKIGVRWFVFTIMGLWGLYGVVEGSVYAAVYGSMSVSRNKRSKKTSRYLMCSCLGAIIMGLLCSSKLGEVLKLKL